MKNGSVIGTVLQMYVYKKFSNIRKYFRGRFDLVIMRFECNLSQHDRLTLSNGHIFQHRQEHNNHEA